MRTPQEAQQAAEHTWAALVPTMAGDRRMRLSRDGGRSYPLKGQRPVAPRLPNQPAALLVYDATAAAPIFCLDLDSSRGDVERDYASLTRLLDRVGLTSWFSDRSPNGGRHIYVPLAEPAPKPEAGAAAMALARQTPTLDPQPMLNAVAGCIRPPGARHKSGGFQTLDQTVGDALTVLTRPNRPEAWRKLLAELDVEQRPSSPSVLPSGEDSEPDEQLDPLAGHTAPDAGYQHTARTGEYDHDRYKTPSQARQSVVWACVAAGWAFVDLTRRLEDGTWRGLASFYTRYPQRHRRRALVRDWRAAVAFEKRRRHKGGIQSVRVRTTSPHQAHARGVQGGAGLAPPSGNVNRDVRVWLAAVDFLTSRDTDLSERAVLYALGQAAVLTGSLEIAHGNRHLAIAAGKTIGGHATVSRILTRLTNRPRDRALVDLIRPASGTRAHTYQLVIPPLLRPACEAKPWRRGRIHGIRPVFRELGLPAAFAYAALEQADEPLTGRQLAAAAGLGHSAGADALLTLAEFGLAERTPSGWVLGAADLDRLAEAWGIVEAIREQIAHYRAERAIWHQWLIQRGILAPAATDRGPPDDSTTWPDPGRDPGDDAAALVERVLGGEALGVA